MARLWAADSWVNPRTGQRELNADLVLEGGGVNPQPPDITVTSTFGEGYRCLRTMMSEWDRYQVEAATSTRTIFVPSGGIAATDFDLTAEQQHALFLNGAKAATEFLIRWADQGIPRSGDGRPSARFPELIA